MDEFEDDFSEEEWVEETIHDEKPVGRATGALVTDSSHDYEEFEEEDYEDEGHEEEEEEIEEIEEVFEDDDALSDEQFLSKLHSSFQEMAVKSKQTNQNHSSLRSNRSNSLASIKEVDTGFGAAATKNVNGSIHSGSYSVDDSASVEFDLGSYQEDMSESSHEIPEDYEQSCRDLIAIVYRGENVDASDMIRRCDLPNLYKNLKQQHKHVLKENAKSSLETEDNDMSWESFDKQDSSFRGTSIEFSSPQSAFDDADDPWGFDEPPRSALTNDIHFQDVNRLPTQVSDESDNNYASQESKDSDQHGPPVEKWLERDADDPEDYEYACRKLIAILYKEDEDHDPDTMIRRSAPRDLYHYLKNQYWFLEHTGLIEEKVQAVDDSFSTTKKAPKLEDMIEKIKHPDSSVDSAALMNDGNSRASDAEMHDISNVESTPTDVEMHDTSRKFAAAPKVGSIRDNGHVAADSTEPSDQKPCIEKWLERNSDDPEDFEYACRKLAVILFKEDDDADVDTMLRRTAPEDLYRYLSNEYWYHLHQGNLNEGDVKNVQLTEQGSASGVSEPRKSFHALEEQLAGRRLYGATQAAQQSSMLQDHDSTKLSETDRAADLTHNLQGEASNVFWSSTGNCTADDSSAESGGPQQFSPFHEKPLTDGHSKEATQSLLQGTSEHDSTATGEYHFSGSGGRKPNGASEGTDCDSGLLQAGKDMMSDVSMKRQKPELHDDETEQPRYTSESGSPENVGNHPEAGHSSSFKISYESLGNSNDLGEGEDNQMTKRTAPFCLPSFPDSKGENSLGQTIEDEMLLIIREAERNELEEPFAGEEIDVLIQAAKKVAYCKKYYDVFRDEFIYLPPVAKTIVDYSLLDIVESEYDDFEGFPTELSAALRFVAGQQLEKLDLDLEYVEKLAVYLHLQKDAQRFENQSEDTIHDGLDAGTSPKRQPLLDESAKRVAENEFAVRSISVEVAEQEFVESPNSAVSDGFALIHQKREPGEVGPPNTVDLQQSPPLNPDNVIRSTEGTCDQAAGMAEPSEQTDRLQDMGHILEFKRRVDKVKLTQQMDSLKEKKSKFEKRIVEERKQLSDLRQRKLSEIEDTAAALIAKYEADREDIDSKLQRLTSSRVSDKKQIEMKTHELEERLEKETKVLEEKRLLDEENHSQKQQALRGQLQSAKRKLEVERKVADESLDDVPSEYQDKPGGLFGVFGARKKSQDLEKERARQAKFMQWKLREMELEKEINNLEQQQESLNTELRGMQSVREDSEARLGEQSKIVEQKIYEYEEEERALEARYREDEAELLAVKESLESTHTQDLAWIEEQKEEIEKEYNDGEMKLSEEAKRQRSSLLEAEEKFSSSAAALKDKWLREEAAYVKSSSGHPDSLDGTSGGDGKEQTQLNSNLVLKIPSTGETNSSESKKQFTDGQDRKEERSRADEQAQLKAEEHQRVEESYDRGVEKAPLMAEGRTHDKAEGRVEADEAQLRNDEGPARIYTEQKDETCVKAGESRLKTEDIAKLQQEEVEKAAVKAEEKEDAHLKTKNGRRVKTEEEAKLEKIEDESDYVEAEEDARLKAGRETLLKVEKGAQPRQEEEEAAHGTSEEDEEIHFKAEKEAQLRPEERAKLRQDEDDGSQLKAEKEEDSRLEAEDEAHLKTEEVAQPQQQREVAAHVQAEDGTDSSLKAAKEAQLKAEETHLRRVEEEAACVKAEEEEAHVDTEKVAGIKAEEEAKLQQKEDEAALLKEEEEEAALKAEEARVKAEKRAKQLQEGEGATRVKAEEEEKECLEAEGNCLEVDDEAKQRKEEEQAARVKAEEQEVAHLKTEENILRGQEELKLRQEEEVVGHRKAAVEKEKPSLEAEKEARLQMQEAKLHEEEDVEKTDLLSGNEVSWLNAEIVARVKAEEEAKLGQEEEEAARLKSEEKGVAHLMAQKNRLRAEEETMLQSNEEAVGHSIAEEEDEPCLKAGEEARSKMEEAKLHEEEERADLLKGDEVSRLNAEKVARVKAEEEVKLRQEEEEASRVKAEGAEVARLKAEENRLAVEEESKLKSDEEVVGHRKAAEEEEPSLEAEKETRLQMQEAKLHEEEDVDKTDLLSGNEVPWLNAEMNAEKVARVKAEEGAKLRQEEEEAAHVKAEEKEVAHFMAEKGEKETMLQSDEGVGHGLANEEDEPCLKARKEARLKMEEANLHEAEEKTDLLGGDEVSRLNAENVARVKAEEEAKFRQEEEEAARLKGEEEEATLKAEGARVESEEQAKQCQEKEEAARLKAEGGEKELDEEAKQRQEKEEAPHVKAEEKEVACSEAEENRLKGQEELKLRQEEELVGHGKAVDEDNPRLKAEQGACSKADEVQPRQEVEEATRVISDEEEVSRLKAEKAARAKAEELAKLLQEEEKAARFVAEEEEKAHLKAEEARVKTQDQAKKRQEEEEAAHVIAEEQEKARSEAEENRLKVDEWAKLSQEKEDAALIRAKEQAARLMAEKDSRLKINEAAKQRRAKEEEAAHVEVEEVEEARLKAEQESRLKAEEATMLRHEEEEYHAGSATGNPSSRVIITKRKGLRGGGLSGRLMKEAQAFVRESSTKSFNQRFDDSVEPNHGDFSNEVMECSDRKTVRSEVHDSETATQVSVTILYTNTPTTSAQQVSQEKSLLILKSLGITPERLDGSDISKRGIREELLLSGGKRGDYPQFYVKNDDGEVSYFGDFDVLENANENGELLRGLLELAGKSESLSWTETKSIEQSLIPVTQAVPPKFGSVQKSIEMFDGNKDETSAGNQIATERANNNEEQPCAEASGFPPSGRLDWWRKNGKRLVQDKLRENRMNEPSEAATAIERRGKDSADGNLVDKRRLIAGRRQRALSTRAKLEGSSSSNNNSANLGPVDQVVTSGTDLDTKSGEGLQNAGKPKDMPAFLDRLQKKSGPLGSARASLWAKEAGGDDNAQNRLKFWRNDDKRLENDSKAKESLEEKRRKAAEARSRAIATRNGRGEPLGSGPHFAGPASSSSANKDEALSTPSANSSLEGKRAERMAEAQRLAEKSARARDARMEREAELAAETRQVEMRGHQSSDEVLNSSPADASVPEQPIEVSSSNAASSALVPQMVREADRLSSFIRRYEKKLETVCKSLLAVAQQYEGDEEAEKARHFPLIEMYNFVAGRDWFKRNSSLEARPDFVLLGKTKAPALAKLDSSLSETSMLEVSSLGISFLEMDGPMEADLSRFLSSLRNSDGRSTLASVRQHWWEVARLSGDVQSKRVERKVDEMVRFGIQARIIEIVDH